MNASPSDNEKTHPILGWLCIGIGTAILLVAIGVLPVDPDSVHAPYPIVGLCGIVLVFGGSMILMGDRSRYNSLAAAGMLVCFALVGGWAALIASPESIEGGLPFLPQGINAFLGKIIFGSGAVLSAALSVHALKSFWNGK